MQDAGFNWYKQKGYIMPRREVSARLQVLQVKGYKNEGYRSQEQVSSLKVSLDTKK